MAKAEEKVPEIFLVSDHTGETAASAARAAMSQFRTRWRYRFFGEIRDESQVQRMMEIARDLGAIVLYTLSRDSIADAIRKRGIEMKVPVVDLLGPVMDTVASHYQLKREFRPGPQHGFTDEHFRRVDAVEFAVRHDDGTNLRTLYEADIVLTGVSRTSKTPVCMYLAQRGYKTGNVPLVPGIDPPRELLDIEPSRVFGLTLDPATLVTIRRARLRSLPSLDPPGLRGSGNRRHGASLGPALLPGPWLEERRHLRQGSRGERLADPRAAGNGAGGRLSLTRISHQPGGCEMRVSGRCRGRRWPSPAPPHCSAAARCCSSRRARANFGFTIE